MTGQPGEGVEQAAEEVRSQLTDHAVDLHLRDHAVARHGEAQPPQHRLEGVGRATVGRPHQLQPPRLHRQRLPACANPLLHAPVVIIEFMDLPLPRHAFAVPARGADGAMTDKALVSSIDNFYMTDPISRASRTMAQCTEEFVLGTKQKTGTHG